MGRHVDKILLQQALEDKGGKGAKFDIKKSKEYKELTERVANLEKAVESLAEIIENKTQNKKENKAE